MKIDELKTLTTKIKNINLLKKLCAIYDILDDELKGIIEYSNYNTNVIKLIIKYPNSPGFISILKLYIESNYDKNILSLIGKYKEEEIIKIIECYNLYKNESISELLSQLIEREETSEDIIEFIKIYHDSKYNNKLKDKLLLRPFNIIDKKTVFKLVRLSNYNENIMNLIITYGNDYHLNNIEKCMPLCIRYQNDLEILNYIFLLALENNVIKSLNIISLYNKYKTNHVILHLIDALRNSKTISEIEEIISLYYKYPNSIIFYINNPIVFKYKNINELEYLLKIHNRYPNDKNIKKIISNQYVLEYKSIEEIEKLVTIYCKYKNNKEVIDLILDDVVLKNRTVDEIERLMKLVAMTDYHETYLILGSKYIILHSSIDDIEWMCNEYVNSTYDKTLLDIIIYSKTIGNYEIDVIKELVNIYKNRKNDEIKKILKDFRIYQCNGNILVSIIKYYYEYECKYDIFNLLIKEINIIKTDNELKEILDIYVSLDYKYEEILFNEKIQKRSISDIRRIIEVLKEKEFNKRIIDILLNKNIIDIKDIDELIDTLLKESRIIKNIEDVSNIDDMFDYINYLSNTFGSDTDINIKSNTPKLKKDLSE